MTTTVNSKIPAGGSYRRDAARRDREASIASFIDVGHMMELMQLEGRDVGGKVRTRLQAEAVRKQLARHLPALNEAIARNGADLKIASSEIVAHLAGVRTEAVLARLRLEAAAATGRSSFFGHGT